jgi:probable addiction module antidote protein
MALKTNLTLKTKPFDAAEYLDDAESQAELLSDAFDSGDAGYIAHALGVIARARGMSNIAREAGVTREALYKALSNDGDPKLSTLLGVTKALGVKLKAAPARSPSRRRKAG